MTCIGVCILDLLEEWRDIKQECNITRALLAKCLRLVFLYAPHSNAAVHFDIVCRDSQNKTACSFSSCIVRRRWLRCHVC